MRFQGRISLDGLKRMLSGESSLYANGPMEGLVIRREDKNWLSARAKLVRADFTQAITEHWSKRGLEWNLLAR